MHVAQRFLEEHESALRPLEIESRLWLWEASTTGSEEAAKNTAAASAKVRKLYTDPAALSQIRQWLEKGADLDATTRRQLELLERRYRANQLSAEMIDELETRSQEIEHLFYNFRGRIDGSPVTDNEVRRLLEEEGDTPLRKDAWEASKQIGAQVAESLRKLALRRNDAARQLGFPDFYTMELELQEIEPAELHRITSTLGQETELSFTAEKRALDASVAQRMGIATDALRPWHYADPFFQEPPVFGDIDLDQWFRDKDVVALSCNYFRSIGLPVDDVIARSDLYERPGKDEHAFCLDVDRSEDVRVLGNVRPSSRWAGTMLHELGHAVYDRFIPADLPYLLRTPPHVMSTEAVAMFFGELLRNVDWLVENACVPAEERAGLEDVLPASRARVLLIFARWALLMINFEREFYRDPTRADLNEVWWGLARRLQQITPPDKVGERHDWASKIHLTVAPVYYHNYLLGELFAAQIRGALRARGIHSGPPLGEFFRTELFRHGGLLRWDDLIRASTGETLDPRHFADELTGVHR